jgi:hypothetical protein
LIGHKLFILLLSNGKVFLFLKDLKDLRSVIMPKHKSKKHTEEQTPSQNQGTTPEASTASSTSKRSAFHRWPSLRRNSTETSTTDDSSARISALLSPGAASSEELVVSEAGVNELISIQRKFRELHPRTTTATTSSSEEHKNDDDNDDEMTSTTPVVVLNSGVLEDSAGIAPSPISAALENNITPPASPRAATAEPLVVAVPETVNTHNADTDPARHAGQEDQDLSPITPALSFTSEIGSDDDDVSVLDFPKLARDNKEEVQAFSEKVALKKLTPFMMDKQPILEKRVALKKDLHKLLTNNLDDLTSVLKTKLVSDKYEEKVKEIYDSILVEMEPLAKKASKEKLDSFKGWFDGMLESHKNSFPEKNWIWHNYVKKALSTLLGLIVVVTTLAARPFIAGVAEYAGSFFETPETSGFKMFKESALKAKATAEVDVENTLSTLPALGA